MPPTKPTRLLEGLTRKGFFDRLPKRVPNSHAQASLPKDEEREEQPRQVN